MSFDEPRDDTRSAIVPLAAVKRVLLGRDEVSQRVPDDLLCRVALHFRDGEVVRGLPHHALKGVFFLRTWDARPAQPVRRCDDGRRWTLPSQEAPLIELLSEISALRGLRHRGQISEVEYERRRSQVLERI